MIQPYLQLLNTETEKEKFERLYYKYRKLMLWSANSILNDSHLAEDAVHEAFLRIIKNFHKIAEIDCHETRNFVVIIVRNAALNIIEKEKHRPENDVPESSDFFWENLSSGIDETLDEVLRKEIIKAVESLPDWAADILTLSSVYGCTNAEIAIIAGISSEAVRKRLQRARALFKCRMREDLKK